MRATPHKTDAVVLVTGSTDGIGRETALELARLGARVVVHGRNAARVAAAYEEVKSASVGTPPAPVVADFSSLAAVRGLALELEQRGVALDALINNAGVYMKRRELSVDGIELTLAVNHFAHVLLTHLLLAGSAGKALSRVINLSSIAHSRASIDLEDIENTRAEFDDYQAYATSKFANVLFTVELARRVKARGVLVNAVHPGVVSTKLLKTGFDMRGPDSMGKGARTSVMLAISPEYGHISGAYFIEGRETRMHRLAADAQLAARYYELSTARVGVAALPPS
ncbi:MAG TPA: SDR family NAD(P)-dependent oxidoreductase [Polyangiaceae bacterium]|jgi:NAD(P)-dependent dehydrogenase (short-subunit alcohol dehydrogenase family)